MTTVITLVKISFEVLQWLIIARVFLSFIPHDAYHPVFRFIYETTEPVLAFFRRLLPRTSLPLDFSPLVAILALQLIEQLVISFLVRII
ncbi:MAG: YggT family protein [Moorellaceae bacterium]